MIWLFVCGILRVASVTAYLVLTVTAPAVARELMVPFALVVWLVAIYDAWDRAR